MILSRPTGLKFLIKNKKWKYVTIMLYNNGNVSVGRVDLEIRLCEVINNNISFAFVGMMSCWKPK